MSYRTRLSIVVLLCVLAVALLPPLASASSSEAQAIVNTAALNVRQGPGTGYSIIAVVYAGNVLPITGRNTAAGWYQISLPPPDGRTGWVSGSLVNVNGELSGTPELAAPAAPVTAQQGSSSRSSVIVFQVSSGGAIYAVNSDGGSLRYITHGMDPALSPDGQWVAFTRWDGQQAGITGSLWIINVNGSGERQIVSGVRQPKSPTWSADGKRIIINMQQDGTVDNLWICMIDGSPVEVPEPVEGERCMSQKADPFWGLLVVNVASGAYENLPRDAHSFAPTWDPVNAWHVIYRGDRGLMNLDLNQKTTWLLQSGGAQRGPVISPDGKKIATTYKQANNWEVHVMNVDGSGEVRLTQTPLSVTIDQALQGKTPRFWNNAAPAWSPDGSQIAFITDRNGSYEIWLMNADGSGQHPILTADALGGLSIKYDGVDERVITWR